MATRHVLLTAAAAIVSVARPTLTETDQMRLAHTSTANQVDVMEYCMAKGWADQAAIDAEKQAAAGLPATTELTSLVETEPPAARAS